MMRPLLFFPLLFALHIACAQAEEQSSCVGCHQDLWQEMATSVHTKHGISCHDCHGGDPSESNQEAAKATGSGYIGIPDKVAAVGKCGACHSNVEKMNAYGVRTDQLALYQTSHHGRALFEKGNAKVAACTDCHGYHDVLPVSDPASPVYPLHVPKTCNRCHGNESLMSRHNLPSDIFKKYEGSVHGRALFEKKDTGVAHCASCHGSHGAVPPGVHEIGATCGKCHANEKKFFLTSVHAPLVSEGKFSECITCHGNHEVAKAGAALYETACVKCHAAGTKGFETAQWFRETASEAKRMVDDAGVLLKHAAREGYFVEDEQSQLEEMKTGFIEMGPAQHSLQSDTLRDLSRRVTEGYERITQEVGRKKKLLRLRKLALIPLWIFIVVMSALLWARYKQLRRSQGRK
jgi:hypothetical protein